MSSSFSKTLLAVLALLLVGGVAAGGYLLYQQQQKQMALENQIKEMQAAQNLQQKSITTPGGAVDPNSTSTMDAPSVMIQPVPAQGSSGNTPAVAQDFAITSAPKRVAVEYKVTPSATDKTQLQARVIDPYFDYNQTPEGVSQVTSFIVDKGSGEFPYTIDYKLSTGAYGGFVVSRTSGGEIDWWGPECMGECPFTDSFKQKYPEIVKRY